MARLGIIENPPLVSEYPDYHEKYRIVTRLAADGMTIADRAIGEKDRNSDTIVKMHGNIRKNRMTQQLITTKDYRLSLLLSIYVPTNEDPHVCFDYIRWKSEIFSAETIELWTYPNVKKIKNRSLSDILQEANNIPNEWLYDNTITHSKYVTIDNKEYRRYVPVHPYVPLNVWFEISVCPPTTPIYLNILQVGIQSDIDELYALHATPYYIPDAHNQPMILRCDKYHGNGWMSLS